MNEEFKDEMRQVHEALTVFDFGERQFLLREMKFKRLNQFTEKVYFAHSKYLKMLEQAASKVGIDAVANINKQFGDDIIGLLNFILEPKDGQSITQEWFEDNLSNRQLEKIFAEFVRQNRADWLLPFFGKFYLLASLRIPQTTAEAENPSGNPTT